MQKRKRLLSLIIAMAAALACNTSFVPDIAAEENIYDINNDGIFSSSDITLMKMYILSDTPGLPSTLSNTNIDFDGNGIINASDFLILVRAYNNFVTSMPQIGTSPDPAYILEPKNTVHTGKATYYTGGYTNGCAMLDDIAENYYVAALNATDYNNAMLAGAYIQVTGPLGSVNCLVTDLLPKESKGDVDLNINAFAKIANIDDGIVPITWKIIPLNNDKPVSYMYKEGSTKYWCGVQVRNHKYPVAKFEYLESDGTYVELTKEKYNYYLSFDMGAGPFTFRITDIYGDVIVDKNIPLTMDGAVQGASQFPE